MTEPSSPSPDTDAEPATLRDHARRLAPYAAGAAVFAAAVFVGGRARHAPVQLREAAVPPAPDPRMLPHDGSAIGMFSRAHVVRSHLRGGVPVRGYVRPRVRRGHEALTVGELVPLLERA